MAAKAKKKKKDKVTILLYIVGIVVFLAALLVTLYPMISNYTSEIWASMAVAEFNEVLDNVDDEAIEKAWKDAEAYNRILATGMSDGLNHESAIAALQDYDNLLNVTDTGIMCHVEIPCIGVYLPVYHGTDSRALDKGAEHLLGTSLPVGGESTHAAISAHTGMASQKMFTDLESVQIGDVFYVHTLGKTLAYEVDQILVVEPIIVDNIQITTGEDYVTLITCTPYAINTHRLLVRGTRIPFEKAVEVQHEREEVQKEPTRSVWVEQYIKGLLAGVAILVLFLIVFFIIRVIRKAVKKEKRSKNEQPKSGSANRS